jgi:hypothetical protein
MSKRPATTQLSPWQSEDGGWCCDTHKRAHLAFLRLDAARRAQGISKREMVATLRAHLRNQGRRDA